MYLVKSRILVIILTCSAEGADLTVNQGFSVGLPQDSDPLIHCDCIDGGICITGCSLFDMDSLINSVIFNHL